MSESKTKIRPQQSCLKCRERKVKCDRSIPCHACIIRGLEAECTYLTTPEDREHISQAEIIDRLRREVAQLRTQLSQGPKPKKPKRAPSADRNARARLPYARPYAPHPATAGATAFLAEAETNWSASSPESTGTRAHSATVNSPDSTGSGSGGRSVASQSVLGSTGPFGTQIVEDVATSAAFIGANFMDDATLSHCQGGIPAFAPADIPTSIPMHGLSQVDPTGIPTTTMTSTTMYHDDSPQYTISDTNNNHYVPIDPTQDYFQMGAPNGDMTTYGKAQYPQNHWHAPESAPAHQYTDSYYSSIQAFAHTNANPHAMVHPQGHSQSPPAPCQDVPQIPGLQIPSSWKGDGKQALLETLLETIGSCDESQVAQVVQVVRTSATPEEAVSGICQVLGISASATTAGRESH